MKWILSLGWIKETVNHFHLKRCCKESNTKHHSKDVILFVPCMGKKALQTCYVLCGETPTQNPAESGWMQLLTEKYRIPNTLRHIFRTYRRDAPSVRPFIYSWTLLLYLLNGVWDIHTTKQDELVQRDHWKNCWRQVCGMWQSWGAGWETALCLCGDNLCLPHTESCVSVWCKYWTGQ